MALTERGKYSNNTVIETGKRVFDPVSEKGQAVFGIEVRVYDEYIKLTRGLEENLPLEAVLGKIFFTTDTKKVYIGNGDGEALTEFATTESMIIDGGNFTD